MVPISVCVIDDDEIYQFTFKHNVLKINTQNTVKQFANGLEALHYFENLVQEKQPFPKIIFLDINMPLMDGWTFLEKFKQIQQYVPENFRLYIVSSSIDEIDYSRAKTISLVHDYIVKPLTIEKLRHLVQY